MDGRNGISLCEFLLISRYGLVSRLPRDLEVPETVNVVSLSIQNKINQSLRHLFGPSGKFRSEKQEEGLLATIEGKSPLFIILPTGAGKSLMFEIPALFKGAKSTIVIVPLVGLAENLLQRCKDDRIDTIIYGRGTPRYAKIIIIIMETAISSNCRQFIQDRFLDGELERIVFDECHMIVTEESYRPKLQELWRLSVPVQYVFMSATYPPSFAPIFQEKMLIKEPFIIRERNEKPKCFYEVMRYEGGMLEVGRIVKNIVDLCIDERKVFYSGMDNLGLDRTETDRDRPILDRVESNRFYLFDSVQGYFQDRLVRSILIAGTDWTEVFVA